MLPNENLDLIDEEEIIDDLSEITDTKTYYINFEQKRLQGLIDGLDSVKQSIICMLETERYAYLIHSWQYGASLEDYTGKNFDFISADIGREIKETLLVDDRIIDVGNFAFEQIEDKLKISFDVNTIYGKTNEKVVI